MKTFIHIILVIFVLVVVFTTGAGVAGYILPKSPQEPSKPQLVMDSVATTPHGHKIYKYLDGNVVVYVFLRHHDGYPMGISTVKLK